MENELRNLLNEYDCKAAPRVLIAASECSPLAKTGGLADVVGTLPKALKKIGLDARVIIPYHRCIREKYGPYIERMAEQTVKLGWRNADVFLNRMVLDGTVIYLIENDRYFGESIYLGGETEGEQYSFFSRAVLESLPLLDFEPEVLHCNDWHTAMIPMLARTQYSGCMQERLHFLFTIHNIAFQGRYNFSFVQDRLGVESRYYSSEYMELYGCASFMKAACVFSDRINTVSPSYAREIRTPEYGEQLDGILRFRGADVSGIINGIDRDVYDPEHDRALAECFSSAKLQGKAVCKAALQEYFGLKKDPTIPLFIMVTRMTEQKGFELILCVLDDLMSRQNMQFVLVGSGDAEYENFMCAAAKRYPDRVGVFIGYDDALSHQLYAGSDFYLMPSKFEPCGLSQMIAMRYGSLPVVRETGGLKDTVIPYNRFADSANGFSFAEYDAWELKGAILQALQCYKDNELMTKLRSNAMAAEYSFDRSALEYARLYIEML